MGKQAKKTIHLDLRYFKRYPKEVPCTVYFHQESRSAKTLDYSFNGLSIIITEPPRILTGDQLTVDVKELNIHQKGRVQWTAPMQSGLRIGLAKLGVLQGSFLHYRLSDMLIGLQKTVKTGILVIQHGLINKELYIKNGDMIYATSNQETDQLGSILLQQKKLGKEHYLKALEQEKKTGVHHSEVLVRNGYLKPENLVPALKLQAHIIIESMLALEEAHFIFQEGPFSSKNVLTLKLSMSNVIYHELKKHADTGLIEEYLLDRVVDFSASPLKLFQHITMDEQDKAIVSLVDGKTKIEEIIKLAPYDTNNVLQTIYALLEARILVIKMDSEAPRGIAFEDVVEKIQDVPDALIVKIERMHAEYKKKSYYEILGIYQNAAEDEIKRAYFKLAKEFHPDLHFNLPRDMKKKLLEVFIYMTNAYLTLKDPQQRKTYRHAGESSEANRINFMKPGEIAESRYLEGQISFRKKEFENAAHSFASAIYFDNSAAKHHYFYGCALGEIGKYKDALEALKKALELKPSDLDTLAEIGHIYLKLGFPLRAKGHFKKVLEKSPAHARATEGMRLIK